MGFTIFSNMQEKHISISGMKNFICSTKNELFQEDRKTSNTDDEAQLDSYRQSR